MINNICIIILTYEPRGLPGRRGGPPEGVGGAVEYNIL